MRYYNKNNFMKNGQNISHYAYILTNFTFCFNKYSNNFTYGVKYTLEF